MTPETFIAKWQAANLKERSAAQEHFIDLCRLLEEPTPAEADPDDTWYSFEKGTTGGGKGWADVWKRHHFAWEYKGKHKNLDKAFVQLQHYALALENPPLLVVSDMETIRIYTNFTNTVQEIHEIALADLAEANKRQMLKWVFTLPKQLKPGRTRAAVTENVAKAFAQLAQRLRERNHEPHQVARFISQLLYCMFAEDAGLFEDKHLLKEVLEACRQRPKYCTATLQNLFTAMQEGGLFGTTPIDNFNGDLFADTEVLPLEKEDINTLLQAAHQDWKDIEPSIFGTLFERGLDPDKRSQLGAHYTEPQSIQRIVKPVVLEPLQTDWEHLKADIEAMLEKSHTKKTLKTAQNLFNGFLDRLANMQVLDPACGSGNFLYLALRGLKDLEHQANLEAEQLGLQRQFSMNVGPQNVNGIEVNPYAAELARITIWIGHIQWMLANGYGVNRDPVLQPLNQIDCRDAVLNEEGTEPQWPQVDFIVGNPPFLGDKKMIYGLGEEYVTQLRRLYKARVPGGADLVTYWFEKARTQLEDKKAKAAGLVATNSIRGGANRQVLDRIQNTGRIFDAWCDEPWVNEGAAVRVSLVCFAPDWHTETFIGENQLHRPALLNGKPVGEIYPDLTGSEKANGRMNLTVAKPLVENQGVSFIGTQKNGPFNIPGHLAREWLQLPANPNGCPNSDVLRPWANGIDIVRRPTDTWIIDFGTGMSAEQAAFYEQPFEYARQTIKPTRVGKREERTNIKWWIFQRPRPQMREASKPFSRYILTPRVSKYRLFIWADKCILPDSATVAIARDDDTTFGILHSRVHELWSLRLCTWLGKGNDPRYTPTTTFETFPFPEGLSPNMPAADYADNPYAVAIAEAARYLNELRDNWLNPPEWVKREPEVVEGYPARLIPVDDHAAKKLKERTLTKLYNKHYQWLINAHRALDEAVIAAYGWATDLSDDEMLKQLLALNMERANNE